MAQSAPDGPTASAASASPKPRSTRDTPALSHRPSGSTSAYSLTDTFQTARQASETLNDEDDVCRAPSLTASENGTVSFRSDPETSSRDTAGIGADDGDNSLEAGGDMTARQLMSAEVSRPNESRPDSPQIPNDSSARLSIEQSGNVLLDNASRGRGSRRSESFPSNSTMTAAQRTELRRVDAVNPTMTASASTSSTGDAGLEDKPLAPPPSPPTHHRILRHTSILSLLAFSSIWGTLAREGLVALNTYAGQSVAPLVWAQAVGCLIMGWATAASNRSTIERLYPPLYIMITTGFCGSVTTFSSWILEVFRAFGDQQHFGRSGLYNVMDALTQTGVTIGMSLIALYAGRSLATVLDVQRLLHLCTKRRKRRAAKEGNDVAVQRPTVSPSHTPHLDLLVTSLGPLFWTGSALLCALYQPFRHVTFSLVLAPPGAFLRWYLSRLNTLAFSLHASLPLGTFLANQLAVLVICASFVSQRVGSVPSSFAGGQTGCWALLGLQDGFCGCLSTVSTLVVELDSIATARGKARAARYLVVSWTVGIVFCVLLVGSPWWSIGMDGRCVGLTL